MPELERPAHRNLFLSHQVDQESMNSLSKAIIDIREHDEFLKKLYPLFGLSYEPKPIVIHIDSYGGAVYQCFGLLPFPFKLFNLCFVPVQDSVAV